MATSRFHGMSWSSPFLLHLTVDPGRSNCTHRILGQYWSQRQDTSYRNDYCVGRNDHTTSAIVIRYDLDGYREPSGYVSAGIHICYVNANDCSGLANGLASTFRLMGGAVATAIYSAILANTFATKLPVKMASVIAQYDVPNSVAPELIQAAALNTADAYAELDVSSQVIAASGMAVKYAYVDAFRLVYLIALAFGGLAIIAASFTKTIPKEQKTMERAIHMENETGGPRAAQVVEKV